MGSHAIPAASHAEARPGDVAHLHEHGHTPVPWLVQWVATTRCELCCPHCLSGGPHSEDMSLEKALDLVDQVADLGVPELLVTGGEPLLRRDLQAVILRLAERGQRWSLNTAVMPRPELRDVLEAHPPSFVAVSLDGPRGVHDDFRGRAGSHAEAHEAMRWFATLPETRVTAGTTVTQANFPSLPATLQEVKESGADAWGLHLCVDEGRARGRPDLFLDRRQLAWLLRFTVRARRWFPVTMADELGYCGEWEPLVRDLPLRCGAGRMQCVVLPDGSVVPCTTMDQQTRAGSLADRSLAEIWRDGFSGIRAWRPKGRCARCDYAPACQGGCWLQRRRGNACFRDVWHVPGALRTAAGLAICLGGLAAGAPAAQGGLGERLEGSAAIPDGVDRAVMAAVTEGVPSGPRVEDAALPQADGEASARALDFVNDWKTGQLPEDLPRMSARIHEALKGSSPSLNLVALAWRALTEAQLAAGDPLQRSMADQEALEAASELLGKTAARWRADILARKLDPYLARGRTHAHYHFEMSKAYIPPPSWLSLQRDTSMERWGSPQQGKEDPLDGWLDRHPFAEQLQLSSSIPEGAPLTMRGPTGDRALQDTAVMGIFDTLLLPLAGDGFQLGIDGLGTVEITGPSELGWADLLLLAWQQQPAILRAKAREQLSTWSRGGSFHERTEPLCLIAVQELAESAEDSETRQEARAWLMDFWMI